MDKSSSQRVVITGLGVVSPLGNDPDSLLQSLHDGTSAVGPFREIPLGVLCTDFGAEARDFTGEISDYGPMDKKLQRTIRKGSKVMCREIEMGVAVAQLALNDAGLDMDSRDRDRTGVVYGCDYIMSLPEEFATGIRKCLNDAGEFQFSEWGQTGKPEVNPLWLLKYLPNMPASHIAIYNDLRGPSNSITVREASANLAIAEATTIIQRGSADFMVAGSTGSRIHPLRTVHIALQEQLADRHTESAGGDPTKACRPFDKNRTGMTLGEGAGVLILEELSSAEKRGANILGEVVGYGSSCVADKTGAANYQTALKNVLLGGLETSGMDASKIGHVHAHGLGSPQCDLQESQAIADVMKDTPVTAAKSYMGNLGGGCGIVEIAASLMAMEKGPLFPIMNCDELDEQCSINAVQTDSIEAGDSFINLNVTPQGQASSVVIQKHQ